MGRAAETEGHIREAFRLSPRDISSHRWMLIVGWSKIQLGADAEAVSWLRRSIEANRNHPIAHFHLAGALALAGSLDEARTAAHAGLALNPNFTIRRWRDTKSSDNPAFLAARERYFEGLRLAGVPEG
jgi:tetratricopeptide (TPR) repeat protein